MIKSGFKFLYKISGRPPVRRGLGQGASFLMWGLVACLFLSGPGLAAAQVLEREYTYRAGEVETRQSSRIIALELVGRLFLEDFGAGLKETADFGGIRPDKEKIIYLAPIIARTEILSETWDGRTYRLRAGIEFDPDEAAGAIIRLDKDRYLVGQLKKSRARADEYLKEINRLKIEPAKPAGREKERYNKAVRCLAAEAWFKQGLSLNQARRYLEAIRAYNKAVGLNPGHVWAYYNRGLTWADKGDLKRAINGYTKALETDPKLAQAYYQRGLAWSDKGDQDRAIGDYTKALEIDPNLAGAYINRGWARLESGDLLDAWDDINKALKLEPDNKTYQRLLDLIKAEILKLE